MAKGFRCKICGVAKHHTTSYKMLASTDLGAWDYDWNWYCKEHRDKINK